MSNQDATSSKHCVTAVTADLLSPSTVGRTSICKDDKSRLRFGIVDMSQIHLNKKGNDANWCLSYSAGIANTCYAARLAAVQC